MEDPRLLFARSIDPSRTKVVKFPGVILVCGGIRVPEPGTPTSLRDYILRYMSAAYTSAASYVVLPEDLFDWANDAVYPNIFDLEEHLAALASVIVIFVESPGSIAELAAFCLLPGVRSKLLVFVQDRHFKHPSFIRLGPLRYLEQRNSKSVLVYPWETSGAGPGERIVEASVEPIRDEICRSIVKSHRASRTHRAFDNSHGDRMLIVCELLNHMIGLRLHEIQEYFGLMGLNISMPELKQYLYVLERLRMVDTVRRGHYQFYIPLVFERHLRFAFKEGAPAYDRDRLVMEVATYYRNDDPARSAALGPVLSRMS
jgi:hypothetical protein